MSISNLPVSRPQHPPSRIPRRASNSPILLARPHRQRPHIPLQPPASSPSYISLLRAQQTRHAPVWPGEVHTESLRVDGRRERHYRPSRRVRNKRPLSAETFRVLSARNRRQRSRQKRRLQTLDRLVVSLDTISRLCKSQRQREDTRKGGFWEMLGGYE